MLLPGEWWQFKTELELTISGSTKAGDLVMNTCTSTQTFRCYYVILGVRINSPPAWTDASILFGSGVNCARQSFLLRTDSLVSARSTNPCPSVLCTPLQAFFNRVMQPLARTVLNRMRAHGSIECACGATLTKIWVITLVIIVVFYIW